MKISTRTIVISVLCVFAIAGLLSVSTAAQTGMGLYTGFALQAPFSWVTSPFVWLGNFFHRIQTADKDIAVLQQQNQALSEQIAQYEQSGIDAAFVRTAQQIPGTVLAHNARVQGFVFGTGGSKFVIDAGTDQGISQDDWVVIPGKILVGKIESVRPHTSVVSSIYGTDLKIASLASDRTPGLFSFQQGRFVMDYIPPSAQIATGTLVQTSGQDGMFAKGFLLGTVRSVHAVSDASAQEALIDPLFSMDQVQNVVVVKNSLKP